MKRRKFTPEFKFKVAVAAISEQFSLPELAKKHQLAPAQISTWKRELLSHGVQVFQKPAKTTAPDPQVREDELLRIIGQLQVENSFLKKNAEVSLTTEVRRSLIEPNHAQLSVRRQCDLLAVSRVALYYTPRGESPLNLQLLRLMDEHYLDHAYKGARRMHVWLTRDRGYRVSRNRIDRLYYKILGLQSLLPGPHTSKRCKDHAVFPYLLRDLEINRSDQVWATDITYVPMRRGFLYLTAIIDLYSRYVVHWKLCNAMEASWCRDLVAEALDIHQVAPEIFNTDQGAQYTSRVFTEFILSKGMRLSMDGKGRATDNAFIERLWRSVKYEQALSSRIRERKAALPDARALPDLLQYRPSALLHRG